MNAQRRHSVQSKGSGDGIVYGLLDYGEDQERHKFRFCKLRFDRERHKLAKVAKRNNQSCCSRAKTSNSASRLH
jgi:hypothetical protein